MHEYSRQLLFDDHERQKLNATFNNMSLISWQSVLLVEETGVPEENHRQTFSRNVLSSTPRHNFSAV
jgi:hypothetical protein